MFSLYGPWPDFTVKPQDWQHAVCADEKHCTVANSAVRQLHELGFTDAEAWVMALFETDSAGKDHIVGHRLTAKVFYDNAWRLFYWSLGEKTDWIARRTDRQEALPTWDITETLEPLGARLSDIRAAKTPEENETRRAGIQAARKKRARMIELGGDIERAKKGEVPPRVFQIAEINAKAEGLNIEKCRRAYIRQQATLGRKPQRGGWGGRARVHLASAKQAYRGEKADV